MSEFDKKDAVNVDVEAVSSLEQGNTPPFYRSEALRFKRRRTWRRWSSYAIRCKCRCMCNIQYAVSLVSVPTKSRLGFPR